MDEKRIFLNSIEERHSDFKRKIEEAKKEIENDQQSMTEKERLIDSELEECSRLLRSILDGKDYIPK